MTSDRVTGLFEEGSGKGADSFSGYHVMRAEKRPGPEKKRTEQKYEIWNHKKELLPVEAVPFPYILI